MRLSLTVTVVAALALTACSKPEAPKPPPGAPAPGAVAPGDSPVIKGKVAERLDAAPYSYLRLNTAAGEVWTAVPQTDLKEGAEVVILGPLPMEGFESKSLKRKFDKIYFGTIAGAPPAAVGGPAGAPAGAAAPAPGGAPGMPAMPGDAKAALAAQHAGVAKSPAADVGEVKVAKATGANAKTVSEVHAQKKDLKEKKVVVRGKVVKFNSGIMGKNWIHLRDGSGSDAKGDNDITATTADAAQVGDVVVITGTVRTDKDFGAGYTYAVIIEDAKVSK